MHAADLLTHRASLTPDRVALVEMETGRRFTYDELNRRANRLANVMRALGVGLGDRVSLLAHNSVLHVDLLYGLAKIGAIFTPLNWRLTVDEQLHVLSDAEPRVLLCGPEFVQVARSLRSAARVPCWLSIEGAPVQDAEDYEALARAASEDEPARPEMLSGETPLCLLYTSGTTGRSKGAIIPHRQVLWNCINTLVSWGLTERDVSPVFTPLFHAGGLFAFLTPLLYAGGRVILSRAFDAERTLTAIVEHRCTVVLGVPTLWQMWSQSPSFESADFSQVRFFISGGAPCPQSVMETWRERKNVVFRQGYGLTEVGPNCFSMTDEDSVPKTGSVGRPIFHTRAAVVDAEGRPVPVGDTGELVLAGPHVSAGYWRNAEASAQVLKDGWFHTGDMARMDEDGFFFIAGRFKDMIISGGENIYAAEVEAVFKAHPAVAEAALVGQPDEKWGEVGVIAVQLKRGASADAGQLLGFCDGRLARYKIPKRVVFVEAIPTSSYGKVVKSELKRLLGIGAS